MIYDLNVKVRKTGEKPDDLLPGVVYGPEVKENVNLSIGKNDFDKLYAEAGENSLINLSVEGEKESREVLVKAVNYNPVSDKPIHVDFYQIKRGQTLDIEATFVFVNEAPAVKELSGVLMTNLDKVEIRCMPRDMISEINIDLSVLKTFEDKIQVKDLDLPETVEILTELEELIVTVNEPEEEEPEEVPVVEGEGEEGAEGAEGEGGEKSADGEAKAEEGEGGEKPQPKADGEKKE
ncbi:50S ribosomal protein L25 [Candidatus Kuenenbacteria bacterium]|nr:50S ribosomal protein L25 [Candidatus Kuenenbacteria bacterium]